MVGKTGNLIMADETTEITQKINKLCQETSLAIRHQEGEINLLLIRFANHYNDLW